MPVIIAATIRPAPYFCSMINPNAISHLFGERLKYEGFPPAGSYAQFIDSNFDRLQTVKVDFCRKNKISLLDEVTRDSIKRGIMGYLGIIKVGI